MYYPKSGKINLGILGSESSRFSRKDGPQIPHEFLAITTSNAILFFLATFLTWLDMKSISKMVLCLLFCLYTAHNLSKSICCISANDVNKPTHDTEELEAISVTIRILSRSI